MNTPETDAATLTVEQRLRYLNGNSLCDMVRADFARRLERERDEYKQILADTLKSDAPLVERLKLERDQLRKVADELAQHLSTHWSDNGFEPTKAAGALRRYSDLPHVIAKKK